MRILTDMRVIGVEIYYIPVRTRTPLKFGAEVLTGVTCCRVRLRVEDGRGRSASGWGETPLSVPWTWPGAESFKAREACLLELCRRIGSFWARGELCGHPIEMGWDFVESVLPGLREGFNRDRGAFGVTDELPWLAALVCSAAFDLALHDAYGVLHEVPVYSTYTTPWMRRDLATLYGSGAGPGFEGLYPRDFLCRQPAVRLKAWHLVGGLDPLEPEDRMGAEPEDGHPVLLRDWIRRDGLTCLKVKLRGTDWDWDFDRMIRVGRLAVEEGVDWLSADFNCTVRDPEYVNGILDRLRDEAPRAYGMLLYVEQPFAYDLEANRVGVGSVSARKPLFLDESAHDWRLVRLGRELGWTGVALKTCKTQSGALLSACWARRRGMGLMVQDLTNPMLAQMPHLLLAAHVGTIMGVETNAMQFYPAASEPEAVVHPGLYRRTSGCVDLTSLSGPGFGMRVTEIRRELPVPVVVV